MVELNFTLEELETMINKNNNNFAFKISYLNMLNIKREEWKDRTPSELQRIFHYCEDLVLSGDENKINEGILWKWFNSYINLQQFDYIHLLGTLESLPNLSENLTANLFLYITYFCKYLTTFDDEWAQKALGKIKVCKDLSKRSGKRTVTQWYYTGIGNFPISTNKESGKMMLCTVIGDMNNMQSEYLSLDIYPHFKAFFVPAYTDLKKGQAFNEKVEAIISFSYDGLRAWDLKKTEKNQE